MFLCGERHTTIQPYERKNRFVGFEQVVLDSKLLDVDNPGSCMDRRSRSPLTSSSWWTPVRKSRKNRRASNTELISLIGQKWRDLSDSEKARFQEGAVAGKVRPGAVHARDPTATRPRPQSTVIGRQLPHAL